MSYSAIYQTGTSELSTSPSKLRSRCFLFKKSAQHIKRLFDPELRLKIQTLLVFSKHGRPPLVWRKYMLAFTVLTELLTILFSSQERVQVLLYQKSGTIRNLMGSELERFESENDIKILGFVSLSSAVQLSGSPPLPNQQSRHKEEILNVRSGIWTVRPKPTNRTVQNLQIFAKRSWKIWHLSIQTTAPE